MVRPRTGTHYGSALAIACAVIALLAAPSAVASDAGCTSAAAASPSNAGAAQLANAAVCLINQRRAAHKLPRLKLRPRLSAAAARHTQDMVRKRYFSHVSRDGASLVDRLRRSRYLRNHRSWTAGENLAWGSGKRGSPQQIVSAWMASPGHRRNILNGRFREIGIGVSLGSPSGAANAATYTTTFGARN